MLLCFFLFTPALAAAPTEIFPSTGSNTALEARKPNKDPQIKPRTTVREPSTAPDHLKSLVRQISAKYGVSESEMLRVISCENRDWNPKAQSRHRYKAGNRWGQPVGSYEQSFGLVQIHLPDHPTITYEQATDPEFAITFMAKKFSEGRQSMWSCY